MASSQQESTYPELQVTIQAFIEVIITGGLAFIAGFWGKVFGFVPFIGGWISNLFTSFAEREWGQYEAAVTDLGEPIIEVLAAWVKSYVTYVLTPVKESLWDLQAAVWRIINVVIPQAVKYIFQTINKSAASGYASTAQDRKTAIQTAAGDIVSNLPIVKAILGRVVSIALDLIEIDQPELRFILGFLLRELINHLGVEDAAGAALAALIEPILGQGPPQNLHDVIARLGSDNNANASWIANYGQPLVSDLAADQRIGQVADGALAGALGLAGLALMVRDPARAGSVMAGTLRVGLPVLSAVSLGVGEPVQAAEFGFLAAMADDPFAWANALAHLAR